MINNAKKGIDVSHWQGDISWKEVALSGISSVMIKMGEGATYTDPMFEINWLEATRAGLSVGAYHYFRALSSTPQEQAEHIKRCLSKVGFTPEKNRLAIDIEVVGNNGVTPEKMADNLYELLMLIKANVIPNYLTTIYCSPGIWDSLVLWNKYDFSIFPLWVAHWDVTSPRLPKSWEEKSATWTLWQYSSKGSVPGIKGPVDLNWIKESIQ